LPRESIPTVTTRGETGVVRVNGGYPTEVLMAQFGGQKGVEVVCYYCAREGGKGKKTPSSTKERVREPIRWSRETSFQSRLGVWLWGTAEDQSNRK